MDLKSLFESTQRRIVAGLTGIRQAVDHGATLGDDTEFACVKVLDGMLPDRYQVSNGFVVDADGRCSDQIDIIVFAWQQSLSRRVPENVSASNAYSKSDYVELRSI